VAHKYNDFYIINLKGQNKLDKIKPIFDPINRKVSKIEIFLTLNNFDEGDLETLLLSSLDKERYTPQNSFMYKNKKYRDTGLWDLSQDEFKKILKRG